MRFSDREVRIVENKNWNSSVSFIFLGVMYKFLVDQEGVDQTYLLPSGFEGCVVIHYNVDGAKPLKK